MKVLLARTEREIKPDLLANMAQLMIDKKPSTPQMTQVGKVL